MLTSHYNVMKEKEVEEEEKAWKMCNREHVRNAQIYL